MAADPSSSQGAGTWASSPAFIQGERSPKQKEMAAGTGCFLVLEHFWFKSPVFTGRAEGLGLSSHLFVPQEGAEPGDGGSYLSLGSGPAESLLTSITWLKHQTKNCTSERESKHIIPSAQKQSKQIPSPFPSSSAHHLWSHCNADDPAHAAQEPTPVLSCVGEPAQLSRLKQQILILATVSPISTRLCIYLGICFILVPEIQPLQRAKQQQYDFSNARCWMTQ